MPNVNVFRTGLRLKSILYLALACIAALHLLSSLPAMYSDWQAYKLASHLELLNQASNSLFQAVRNYGFERGRVNVVLGDAGPVNGMAKNRLFITKKRQAGDHALSHALTLLDELELANTEQKTASIKTSKT